MNKHARALREEAERTFYALEACEGHPKDDWNKLEALAECHIEAAVREALERAARVCEELYPRLSAHTYGSENADRYIAQEETCAILAEKIRALLVDEGTCEEGESDVH